MLDTKVFGELLRSYGFDFYSGVPCSFLKFLINYAANESNYIAAANEGDAIAIAVGAFLGGKKSVVMMQNSGLANAVSPLTSLTYIFRVPLLGFVSLRGQIGIVDEPQHELMGEITTGLLDLMKIRWEYLSSDLIEANQQIEAANKCIADNKTFFFVVQNETFNPEKLSNNHHQYMIRNRKIENKGIDQFPKRSEALEVLGKFKDKDTILLATTGYIGRELYQLDDSPHNFYMVGSMGCVSSIGLGLSLVRHDKKVVAIDGDGALIMRLGSMATNAYYRPPNMFHILLDNSIYESTGAQPTVSENIDFASMAASAGYPHSLYAKNLKELEEYMSQWKKNGGLTFCWLKIKPGVLANLGRPKTKPFEIKERLLEFLKVS
jgi:phosphonopyruvate decarboxylase